MTLTIPDLSGSLNNYVNVTFYVNGEQQDSSPYISPSSLSNWDDQMLEDFLNTLADAWHIAYPEAEVSYTVTYGAQGQLTTEPTIAYPVAE